MLTWRLIQLSPVVCVTVVDSKVPGLVSDREVDACEMFSFRLVKRAITLSVEPCIGRMNSAGENVTPGGSPCLLPHKLLEM